MEYTAEWGPKGFVVSPEKIVPFDDFSASYAFKSDSNNNTSGTSQTNGKGLEPQKIALSTTYIRAAGVDPRAQVEEWTSLLGEKYPLYIEGKRFGPLFMQLTKVDVSDLIVANNGVFLRVTITIALEEYAVAEKKATYTGIYTPPKTSNNTTNTGNYTKEELINITVDSSKPGEALNLANKLTQNNVITAVGLVTDMLGFDPTPSLETRILESSFEENSFLLAATHLNKEKPGALSGALVGGISANARKVSEAVNALIDFGFFGGEE